MIIPLLCVQLIIKKRWKFSYPSYIILDTVDLVVAIKYKPYILLDMNTIKRRWSKMNVTINAYVGVLRIYDFPELSSKNSAILTIWELQRFSLHVHCCISMFGISILIPSISSYFLMGVSHLNSNPNPVAYLETQTVENINTAFKWFCISD